MRRPTALLPVAVLLAVAACSGGPDFGAPEPISAEGDEVLGLWRGSVWTGLAVGALVWGLVAWSVLRYRRRSDDLPDQGPENIPVEIAYTVAPLVVVAVLFAFTVVTQEEVTALDRDPDVVVEVIGFQWSWEFRYPEQQVRVESDGADPPVMVLPVDSTVRFDLSTADVNHSFWVPELLVKRDLIAGVPNRFDAELTETGRWRGRCAEFCGLDHWRMAFDVEVVPRPEFDRWVAER